jgi:hypothetical protein
MSIFFNGLRAGWANLGSTPSQWLKFRRTDPECDCYALAAESPGSSPTAPAGGFGRLRRAQRNLRAEPSNGVVDGHTRRDGGCRVCGRLQNVSTKQDEAAGLHETVEDAGNVWNRLTGRHFTAQSPRHQQVTN